MICEYGCGQEANHQFKNGKWCCSKNHFQCEAVKNNFKNTCIKKYGVDNPNKVSKIKEKTKQTCIKKYGVDHPNKTKENKEKIKKTCIERYGVDNVSKVEKFKNNFKNTCIKKYGVDNYKKSIQIKIDWIKNHNFFCTVEDIKIKNNEFKVRCKNHNCPNSKEQGGWFTPSYTQLYERVRALENEFGSGGSYFYCSDKCKNECPLFNLYSDPFKIDNKLYTQAEYQTFREFVLKRDNYKCQYCGKKAEHVHHERPQKLEPFFALDPDLAWSVCKKCHYKYGHRDECSTGKLAHKVC